MTIRTTDESFTGLRFVRTEVEVRTANIDHEDALGRGPFCRLLVSAVVPATPGVYAWCVDDEVMYVGKARQLRQVIQGVQMARAYNDYTYVPESKLGQTSSPRVRINGLRNRAVCNGSTISWWWTATGSERAALHLEARLIREWGPVWNKAGR